MPDTAPSIVQAPIAIVGLGSLYPGSETPEGFWRDIVAARDMMTEVPPSHWLLEDFYDPDPRKPDKTYARRGTFLPEVEFDPLEFGIPPSVIRSTDTAQLLSLIVARNVLEDVGNGNRVKIDRERTSVVLGFTGACEMLSPMVGRLQKPIWARALRESGMAEAEIEAVCERAMANYAPWDEATFPGLLGNVVAGRIANRLDLHGANLTTDAACASSLAAVHSAVNQLLLGETDLAIVGGVDANNDIFVFMCFSKTPAISPSGDCRPFSANADGTMMGEGIGMMALKRLDDAERDGNRIYAVISGVGFSSDGRSKSIYAPRGDGQQRAVRRAHARAGVSPGSIDLLEAHGTGTPAGDAAEMEGLRAVFGGAPIDGKPSVALGSVKSQFGHMGAAAGAAGLLKTVMALHQKVLPPTINVTQPDPQLRLEASPFYLNTAARPWISAAGRPRRAGVSAFGFGGTNYHVVLQEYLGHEAAPQTFRLRTTSSELVLLSAATTAELREHCTATALDAGALASIAMASQSSFAASAPLRLAIVAESRADLGLKLAEATAALKSDDTSALATPGGVYLASGPAAAGEVALLFPGQGSQYVGMGGDLAMAFRQSRQVWDELADARFDGDAVHEVVFPPPVFDDAARQEQEARLRATEWAQPALGVAGMAAYALVARLGLRPDCFIGHSFGELSALCAAGVFSSRDLLRLARTRGSLMREAATTAPGGMTALFTTVEAAMALIARAGGEAVVANLNAEQETVVSGSVAALERVEALCGAGQVKFRRLPVSAAFHSPAVAGIAQVFALELESVALQKAAVAVLGNADAQVYPTEAAAVRRRLAEQLTQPVRFAEQIEAAYARGVRTFVEMGPGSALSELARRVLKQRPHLAVSIDRKSRNGVTSLHHALAQLCVAGVALRLAPLWQGYDAATVRPAKRPGATVTLTGTNYGKLYPPNPKLRASPSRPVVPVAASAMLSKPAQASVASLVPPAPVRSVAPAAPPAAKVAPVLPMSAVPMPLPGVGADDAWAQAYQAIQRKTAETHTAVSQAMAESHAAFLATMSTSFADLTAIMTGQRLPPAAGGVSLLSAAGAGVAALPISPDVPGPDVPGLDVPGPDVQGAVATIPDVPMPAVSADTTALLLRIVAESTGYQADMLNMAMDLEADLGIDSIKRVEILAAMREAAPLVPDIGAADMAAIRTLGDVVSYLNNAGSEGPKGKTPAALTAVGLPAPAPVASETELVALLLRTVAEHTGYQPEMLNMAMDLEADLGVDSIKRVEILAAMRDAVPVLPDVGAADMAAIRTLGDVIGFLRGTTPGAGLHRSVPEMRRRAPAGVAMPGLFDAKRLVVTDDGGGIAGCVVDLLAAKGVTATVVAEPPGDADGVVFLGGLAPVDSVDAAIAVNRRVFHMAQTLAPRFSARSGLFVTVQDTDGDFGQSGRQPLRAWLGGVAALARAARLEWPKVAVKAIDCACAGRTPGTVAEAIVAELLLGGAAGNVGLAADGARSELELTTVAAVSGMPALAPGSVVIASGGGRGVTAACMVELARACRPHIVLLGRSALIDEPACCATATDQVSVTRALLTDAQFSGTAMTPPQVAMTARAVLAAREVRETIAAITKAGGQASYHALDVQDSGAVSALLANIRTWHGPIKAIVHGAGVLADRRIADKTPAQFDTVFDTKVLGLRALLEATQDDALDVLCLFSSVVAHTGNAGQSDYAMANAVLNHVAAAERARRGAGCVARAIGWGPWEGGMVTPALRQHIRGRGIPLIALDAGARGFVAELSMEAPAVVLLGAGEGALDALGAAGFLRQSAQGDTAAA